MSTRQSSGRSVIFWLFLFISIPIAVVLLSYASGLRFDRDTGTVIETAALSIETQPRGALVTIDGGSLERTTPLVHSVSPGMYTLELSMDNHHAWKKEVTVHRGKSELFSNVILFAHATPFTTDVTATKQSFSEFDAGDGRTLRALDGPETLIIDDRHQTSFIVESRDVLEPLVRIDERVSAAQWNQNNTLLFATDNDLSLYTVGGDVTLLRRQGLRILDVAWHPENQYVFYSDLTGLYALELDPRDVRQRWKLADVGDAQDLIVSDAGDTLYYRSGETNYSLQLY